MAKPTTTLPAVSQCSFPRTGKRGVPQQFPRRLYEMLNSEAKRNVTVGSVIVIAWSPSGKAFRIYNVKEFSATILPKYFRTTKFSSFQRNLNLYGFEKNRRGALSDMYSHPSFIRDNPEKLIELRKVTNSTCTSTPVHHVHRVDSTSASSEDDDADTDSLTPTLKTKNRTFQNKHRSQLHHGCILARSVSPTISNGTESGSPSPHSSPIFTGLANTTTSFNGIIKDACHHPTHAIVFPMSKDTPGRNEQVGRCGARMLYEPSLSMFLNHNYTPPAQCNRIPCDDHFKTISTARRLGVHVPTRSVGVNKSTSDRGHLDLLACVIEYEYLKSSCLQD